MSQGHDTNIRPRKNKACWQKPVISATWETETRFQVGGQAELHSDSETKLKDIRFYFNRKLKLQLKMVLATQGITRYIDCR